MRHDEAQTLTLTLLLGRLERLNDALVTGVCRRHGVSPSELRVLAMLRHGANGGVASPTHLAHWIVQTSGGLTSTLRRLEVAGLVERIDDPDDGRGRLVALTESGRGTYDEVFSDLTDRAQVALSGVDVERALGVVHELVAALERAVDMPSSGPWFASASIPGTVAS